MGGTDGINALTTVESLCPITFIWRKRHHLQHERAGAAVVVHNDLLWAIGGRNSTGDILSSVEVYDADHGGWIYYPSL